ncbi:MULTISPECIES: hypothetical protein [unclassified Polaribacter]|uniref:hypothetical protein n=1 Tax=unclassified Polaribacter TaxID=196858 RepID=UPI000068C594|nr:hypothetical protein [Polaribacter sp. MED152]EAQ42898.1 hypothetical protein MED152_09250 [Polaribacter sp. MED152]
MEQPNLSLIKEIAGNDEDFQNSIFSILKKEFPIERDLYMENFGAQDLEKAADDVHKLKHKISLLGLPKGFEIATKYEKELRASNTELHDNFVEILNKIHVYLNN